MENPALGGVCGKVYFRMRLLAVLALAVLPACGGGGAAPDVAVTTSPPPAPSDVTASVVTAWAELYESTLDDYETARQDTERQMAANGSFSSGAHYEAFRENCLNRTAAWAGGARNALTDAERGGTTDRERLSDLVEDYRQDFLDYMLASYDDFHSRAQISDGAAAQIRQEIIDGINAVFDDLQADV